LAAPADAEAGMNALATAVAIIRILNRWDIGIVFLFTE
jgi:hypothetical protein